MSSDELQDALSSLSVEERIAATYRLQCEHLRDIGSRALVRANLDSGSPDLVEITIMRLLIRGKDAHSAPKVRALLSACFKDDLVFCAALSALTNLARDCPETALATLQVLEALPRRSVPPDRGGLLAESVAELRRMVS